MNVSHNLRDALSQCERTEHGLNNLAVRFDQWLGAAQGADATEMLELENAIRFLLGLPHVDVPTKEMEG